jgi:hypothetical protein
MYCRLGAAASRPRNPQRPQLAGLKQGEMLHAQVLKSCYKRNICASGNLFFLRKADMLLLSLIIEERIHGMWYR